MKKRIDVLLVEKGLAETRSKAQAYIMAGQVVADDVQIDKSGTMVDDSVAIAVKETFPYVSRGALKLEKAFHEFNLDFSGKTLCDIGSSTGGFSDFALQKGAAKVYAIDVGRGQLDQKIRENPKVVVMEKTDFRSVTSCTGSHPVQSCLPEKIDYFLCDVSFISIKLILPHILDLQPIDTKVIALIKPQFEAGAKDVSCGKGVIKSEQKRQEIVESIKVFAQKLGYKIEGFVESPITGAKGNVEYLLNLTK